MAGRFESAVERIAVLETRIDRLEAALKARVPKAQPKDKKEPAEAQKEPE